MRTYADEGPLMEELLSLAYKKRLASRFLAEMRDVMRAERAGDLKVTNDFGDRFTNREVDVMRLLCEGRTNAEISEELYLSLSTVKNYTHAVYQKPGVRNRASAIARIREKGLLG